MNLDLPKNPASSLDVKKRMLLALRETAAKQAKLERSLREPIAVVGMACRFPGGADTPDKYWRLLREGKDAVTEVPKERWDIDEYYDPDASAAGKMYMREGGFLREPIDRFDSEFFGISPREARAMDPQQRLLLEVAWEALENSGQTIDGLKKSRTGVFAGMMQNDYASLQLYSKDTKALDSYTGMGNLFCFSAGRLSYLLGLRGPSLTLDTACSSSLAAVHLACQSLRSNECRLALAGGTNLMISPNMSVWLSVTRSLSLDGRCKTFDSRADGFGRGEGCGMVILKRLSDARADGDNILALIRGSGINHDGPSGGLTVPSKEAQEELIRGTLKKAGVKPAEISYVEAHGTGTSLGDPIEVRALATALGEERTAENPLLISSAKANIAHLESAAGVAGLIKVVLQLLHKEIPPNPHFKEPNPHIDWGSYPIAVPVEQTSWTVKPGQKRLAGISSFGMSGTNAHVILEEAPETKLSERDSSTGRSNHLFVLSAKTERALYDLSEKYIGFLESNPEVSLPDICFTAGVGRSYFECRLAMAARSTYDLKNQLQAFVEGGSGASIVGRTVDRNPKLVFVFSGQGSQWTGMGRQLMKKEPAFKEELERCDAAVRKIVGWSVIEELTASEAESRLDRFDVVQPVLFSVQAALAALWRSWGVEPDMVVGHSFGEISAAYAAGILRLEKAAAVICHRSRLMARLSGAGAMMAAELSAAESLERLKDYGGELSVAVCNSPGMSVISGDATAMEDLKSKLSAEDVFCRYVKVDVAAHSHYMDGLREEFLESLGEIEPRKGSVPICSTVVSEISDGSSMDAVYWARNLRKTVLFSQSVELLLDKDYSLFLEISPHPVLVTPIKETLALKHAGNQNRTGGAVASLRREQDESAAMLTSLGSLYKLGYPVDWRKLYAGRRLVSLPTYAWQRERYWIDVSKELPFDQKKSLHPLLGAKLLTATRRKETLFESWISPEFIPWLNDHRVFDNVVFPGAAFFESALAAGSVYFKTDQLELGDVLIREALSLPEDNPKRLQLALETSPETGQSEFRTFSLNESVENQEPEWIEHCSGRIIPADQNAMEKAIPAQIDLPALQKRCSAAVPLDEFHQDFNARHIEYGPNFQGVKKLWRGEGEALAELELPKELSPDMENYHFHPALLDAAMQTSVSLLPSDAGETYLPVGADSLKFYRPSENRMWCHVRVGRNEASGREAVLFKELRLFTNSGTPAVALEGLLLKKADPTAVLRGARPWKNRLYRTDWIPKNGKVGVSETSMVSKPRHWLIFAEDEGIGRSLAESLIKRSGVCVLAIRGKDYERINEHEFRVNPENPADFGRLFEELKRDSTEPARSIAYLWGVDAVGNGEITPENLERNSNGICLGLLFMIQSLLKAQFSKPPSLWLVTRNSQPVLPESSPSVIQASLWGMGRTLAIEHPELSVRMVDLEFGDSADTADVLLKEIAAPDNENHIAFRNAQRYAARMVKSRLPETAEILDFKADASYLITGGLGGLGLKMAQWMVEHGARCLILIGRSGISAENKAAKSAIEQMKRDGVEVMTAKVDVADRTSASELIETIKTSMPTLKGIIHSAGIVDDAVLQRLSREKFGKVMAPKTRGAWNLHDLSKGLHLDFFVCFSSMSAMLGFPGQAHYAAANAFMDALAHHRRSLGLSATSINWGAWGEVGLAAGLDKSSQTRMSRIMQYMPPELGLRIMERIFTVDIAQVGVMSANWPELMRQFFPGKVPLWLSEQIDIKTARLRKSDILEQLRKASKNDRPDILIKYLQTETAMILGLKLSRLPDMQKPFLEMGMDSLMALEMRNMLAMNLETPLSSTLFFKTSNIEELALYLIKEIWGEEAEDKPDEEKVESSAYLEDINDEDVDDLFEQALAKLESFAE